MTAWLTLALAHAATVEIALDVEAEGALTESQVQSIVWHALARDLGHDAVFVAEGAPPTAPGAPRWTMAVSWDPQVLRVDGHLFATLAPRLRVDDGSGDREWLGTALVLDHAEHGWVSLPDAALMRTFDRSAPALSPPIWHAVPQTLPLPIVLTVDEEFRAQWGEAWVEAADARVAHANALLGRAGIALTVVGYEAARSAPGASMHALLRDFDRLELPDRATLRIGLTGQVRADMADDVEDVAVAYVPGQTVVLADQVPPLPSLSRWDAAEEGTAMAHEVLHALGIPHLDAPGHLMSAVKEGMVFALSDRAQTLATAAMAARTTRDPMRAVGVLETAATALPDRRDALVYITHNLDAGIGVPSPGLVDPDRLTPLANVALGRHYLSRAARDPHHADTYRRTAALHSHAAVAHVDPQDAWAPLLDQFAAALCEDSPWTDADGRSVCADAPPGTPEIDVWNRLLDELPD